MGQLAGLEARTTIEALEIVSDDQQTVLTITHTAAGSRIRLRRADAENRHESKGPEWFISPDDTQLVTIALSGGDARWYRHQTDRIPSDRFRPAVVKPLSELDPAAA